MRAFATLFLLSTIAVAQQAPVAPQDNRVQPVEPAPELTTPGAAPAGDGAIRKVPASAPKTDAFLLPAGTQIPVTLKHSISTKSARENDPIYGETAFPIVSNGNIVIPAGTYVQGVVVRSKRPGRVKGHGELMLHFTTLIFPSGYAMLMPGSIDNVPGAEQTKMKDSEGTIENDSSKVKLKDVGTIATTTAAGAGIGAAATGSRGGVLGGAAVGAGLGLGSVLLTRGPEVRLESGAMVEMVLEHEIVVEHSRAEGTLTPKPTSSETAH